MINRPRFEKNLFVLDKDKVLSSKRVRTIKKKKLPGESTTEIESSDEDNKEQAAATPAKKKQVVNQNDHQAVHQFPKLPLPPPTLSQQNDQQKGNDSHSVIFFKHVS